MKNLKIILVFSVLFPALGCSIEPRPIDYGKDHCAYCEMTVMDNRYGTEIVTSKGKTYTFDSIECLVEYLQKNMKKGEEASHVLVTAFTRPGVLVDAESSWYLHTRKLPSPMGMYLTAFESEQELYQFKNEKGGLSFTWKELLKNFPTLNPSLLSD